jgi:hypothetical protein
MDRLKLWKKNKGGVMKSIIIILLALVICSGCAMLSYQTSEGTKVTYTRFLTTASSIEAKVGSSEVRFDGQKINDAILKAIISAYTGGK